MPLNLNLWQVVCLYGVTFDGIENLNVTASNINFNDLLIVQGTGNYDGKSGTDTIYADWSNSTTNITWNNDPTQTQIVNGITVSGLERLLLMTGSGDDTLSNLNTTTDDYFDSGAGNDNIQSGAGNDTLHGGSGVDVLQGGDGNDVYQFNIGDGHDQIIDTAGTDRLVFGANITASQIGVSRVGNEIRLAISADDSIRFTENAVGNYAIERIEFQDGTVWTTTQIQQKLNSIVNHAPVLNTSIKTTFTEQMPVSVSNSISINDADGNADWNGGSLKVQITANHTVDDGLALAKTNNGGIWLSGTTLMSNTTAIGSANATAVSNGTAWTFTFNAAASNALVQETARAIQFNNISNTPNTVDRTVTFTATDKNTASASANQTVSVIAVNDAPIAGDGKVVTTDWNTGVGRSVVMEKLSSRVMVVWLVIILMVLWTQLLIMTVKFHRLFQVWVFLLKTLFYKIMARYLSRVAEIMASM